MKRKIRLVSIWLLPGLTIVFQIIYYLWLRGTICDVGMFFAFGGGPSGTTPRDVADHFVRCVGWVHYFLFGYLYSVKRHDAEKRLRGKNGRVKRWLGLEIFCQLGIFFSYLLVWVDNYLLIWMNDLIIKQIMTVLERCYCANMLFCPRYRMDRLYHTVCLHWRHGDMEIIKNHWGTGTSHPALYLFLIREGMIPTGYTWVEEHEDIFDLTFTIAPVLLALLIYGIHCLFRFIQWKRRKCLNIIWAIWTVVFLCAILWVVSEDLRHSDFSGWWWNWHMTYGEF